jgi:hypothetical protein
VTTKTTYKKRKSEGICGSCGCRSARLEKVACDKCAAYKTPWRNKIRDEVFKHYGNRCSCLKCKETNTLFLTIHHLTKEARQRDSEYVSKNLCVWLKKLNYPTDVCLMCFNCNCGIERNGGLCPHEIPSLV